jgi:hypothetical protein
MSIVARSSTRAARAASSTAAGLTRRTRSIRRSHGIRPHLNLSLSVTDPLVCSPDGHLPRPRLPLRPGAQGPHPAAHGEEVDISYKRRILHGKIDILRAELVNRLRKKHEGGEDVITGDDVQKLTDILAGRAAGDGEEAE